MVVLRVGLALAILLPTGAAGWASHGQSEPDTPHDAGWMWPGAPTHALRDVYFQAYATYPATGASPNLATIGSRLHPQGALQWEAILGVWSDCNGDGAIGLYEGAVEEYDAKLLLDTSRCPPGPGGANDGQVVREILWIGRGAEADLRDDQAMVWGDAGTPGARGQETCRVLPLPRGTTSNTGRLLRVLDCASEHRLIGAVNTVDNDGGLGLAIEDPHHPERSGSRLVTDLPVSLFGNPMNGQHGLVEAHAPATFVAYDCESGVVVPTLAADPLSSSAWNATARLADEIGGDCDPATGTPLDGLHPGLEQPFEPTSHAAREQNDAVLVFAPRSAPRLSLGPWKAVPHEAPAAPPRWHASASFVDAPEIFRGSTLDPAPASHWTFYAYVGSATTARFRLPVPDPAPYGAEACGENTAGIHRGWACDPDDWWRDPAGDIMPRDGSGRPWGARPGDPYRLRDIDCADGLVVAGSGIHAGPGIFGQDVCAPG